MERIMCTMNLIGWWKENNVYDIGYDKYWQHCKVVKFRDVEDHNGDHETGGGGKTSRETLQRIRFNTTYYCNTSAALLEAGATSHTEFISFSPESSCQCWRRRNPSKSDHYNYIVRINSQNLVCKWQVHAHVQCISHCCNKGIPPCRL